MPLTDTQIAQFQFQLNDLAEELRRPDAANQAAQKPVELDQQAIGRLSRMDAMQHQAMAQATGARRNQQISRIHAALARIDDGSFGVCTDCGEDIPPKRLALDPATALCVSCRAG